MEVVRKLEVPPGWDTSKNGVSAVGMRMIDEHSMLPQQVVDADLHALHATATPRGSQMLPMCPLLPLPCCLCHSLQDYDHVALLARETVQEGHSVLVFCGTKAACEHTAKRAARWAGHWAAQCAGCLQLYWVGGCTDTAREPALWDPQTESTI